MSRAIPVFVNGALVEMSDGATALDAVRAIDPAAARDVEAGARLVTDSRGLPVAPDAPARAGSIFRVISARARDAEPDADLLH